MPRLVGAMAALLTVFNEYAGKDGDEKTLTRAELIELLHNEFPVTGDSNKAEVDEFFSMLDGDKDGVVDFKEYVTFVTALTVLCN
ncbi:ictacalcin-like [Trachinotus anak]|uniref:ictacalcin-like n=1 Tax=Trachinotus anak TaxID=443729 RepID=UPI0039F2578C